MLGVVRKQTVAALCGAASSTCPQAALPPVFLCPSLLLRRGSAGRRRRQRLATRFQSTFTLHPLQAGAHTTSEADHAKDDALRPGPSSWGVASSNQEAPDDASPNQENGASQHAPHHSDEFLTRAMLKTRNARGRIHRKTRRSHHNTRDGDDLDELSSLISYGTLTQDYSMETGSRAKGEMKTALGALRIKISRELRLCQEIAVDILRKPTGTHYTTESVSLLDECRTMLFGDEENSLDAQEIIAAVLVAAALRIGDEQLPFHIVRSLRERCAARGHTLKRERWGIAISEALRLGLSDFTEHIIDVTEMNQSGTLSPEALEECLASYKSMIIEATGELHDAQEGPFHALNDTAVKDTPRPQVFAALAQYHFRIGNAARVRDIVRLHRKLLPGVDIAALLHHVVRLHPSGRYAGVLLEIIGDDIDEQDRVLEALVLLYASAGDMRNVVRIFHLAGLGRVTPKAQEPVLSISIANRLLTVLFQRSQTNAAMHFFILAHTRCEDDGGSLTPSFINVCQALMEAGTAHYAVAFALRVLHIQVDNLPENLIWRGPVPESGKPLPVPRYALGHIIRFLGHLDDMEAVVRIIRSIILSTYARDKAPNFDMLRAMAGVFPRFFENASWKEVSSEFDALEEMSDVSKRGLSRLMHNFLKVLQEEGSLDQILLRHKKKIRFIGRSGSKARSDVRTKSDSREEIDSTAGSDQTSENHRWVAETRFEPSSPAPFSARESRAAQEMDLSKKLSAQSYALRLRVYGVIRKDFQSAQDIYRAMIQHGIRPTLRHADAMIEALVLQDRLADARLVRDGAFNEMARSLAASRIMSTIIRAFARHERWSEVLAELRLADRLAIVPDESLYGIVNAAIRKARLQIYKKSTRLDELDIAAERLLSARAQPFRARPPQPGKQKGAPAPHTITAIYVAKSYGRRMYEAQCDMAEALKLGTYPDARMRDRLRNVHRFILREIAWAGYKPEDLLKAVEGTLEPSTEVHRRFHSPLKIIWGRCEDGTMSASQRKRIAGPPVHPRELGYALHLSLQNRKLALENSNERDRVVEKEMRARQAMMDLVREAFATQKLFETAQADPARYNNYSGVDNAHQVERE